MSRIENSCEFSVCLQLRECKEQREDGTGRMFGMDALDAFADVLAAFGMGVEIEQVSKAKATLRVCHPAKDEARQARTRNAGRPSGRHFYAEEMGTTDAERLAWLESHTPEEGMAALGGVSQRTYYRRLATLRKRCQK